jgi:hypothetical protein
MLLVIGNEYKIGSSYGSIFCYAIVIYGSREKFNGNEPRYSTDA